MSRNEKSDPFDGDAAKDLQHVHEPQKADHTELEVGTLDEMDRDEPLSHPHRQRESKNIIVRCFRTVIPPGGLISCSFTLCSSTLGAGILGLPSAFNNMGMASAIIILLICVVLTIYSLWLVAYAAEKTGLRTYPEIVEILLGKFAGYSISIILILNCIGGAVSYVISISNFLTPILDDDATPAYLRTWSGNKLITSLIWLVFIWPLCIFKRIDNMRYCSFIGVACMVFFVICLVENSCEYLHKEKWRSDIVYFGTGTGPIETLGTFLFACQVQMNAFEIYHEMAKPTPRRMFVYSTVAMCLCGFLYIVAGVFGYARFGSEVTGSILLKYQPRTHGQHVFWVAYFGILFKLCVAYALHQIPMRESVYHFINWDVYEVPWLLNAAICTVLASISLILGIFVPTLNTVLGLTGSFCGGFIGFVFPALMFMYTGNWTFSKIGAFHYLLTYFLLISGVIAIFFGTIASIYSVV
ncbi:transmembrane amino acid transporter [Strigomonas culicis]|uniref:Transmembrane amino acid transporter n=1 Tax=Strigomonas culicis TaxID=28005 RepID=S9U089_9TRYP|nr:transmembrane amino acid transporter [Strigomonas culicis]|eukprot:EPY22333.1 transmembrane amino acid transporter [Strigomonas culicis]